MKARITFPLIALAAIAFCALPALADEPAAAELPTLQNLTIVSGAAVLPGAERTLPADAAFVAREFPGATFAATRTQLVVGVKSDAPAGTILGRLEFKSDCPNNSRPHGGSRQDR